MSGKQGFNSNLIGKFVQPVTQTVAGITFRPHAGGWRTEHPYGKICGTFLKEGEPRIIIETPEGELFDTFMEAIKVVESPSPDRIPHWDELTLDERNKVYAIKKAEREKNKS